MIKIKPLTKDELLKENAVLKEKIKQVEEKINFTRMEIIKLVFPNYNETHNSYYKDHNIKDYTWMRICFEIGKLKQADREVQMNYKLIEQSNEIDQLKTRIAKLCPESKDDTIT